jgi:hypothetical protein
MRDQLVGRFRWEIFQLQQPLLQYISSRGVLRGGIQQDDGA